MGPRGPKHCMFGNHCQKDQVHVFIHFNPFVPNAPFFLYPLKSSNNRKVFWYFQGALGTNGLMLENISYHHFTWRGPNSQEIVNLFQFSSGLRGPTIGTKFIISCEFGPLQVKWWYDMFSNMNKGGIHGIWSFWHFSSKSSRTKIYCLGPYATLFL